MSTTTEAQTPSATSRTPASVPEAVLREVWPSIARFPAIAGLGRLTMSHWFLWPVVPFVWLLMAPFYFQKILPFLATRYRLTNRRLMYCRGLLPRPVQEVPLSEIDEVRVVSDANSDFFRAATLEILGKGQVKLILLGVPSPESVRHAILNAARAWGHVHAQSPAS
ncbi:MAG: PH domain-containing protein [Gemmataceae bacterium]